MSRLPALVILVVFSAGCGVTVERLRPAQHTTYRQLQAGFSPADRARIERHCPFGMPKTDPSWNHGRTVHIIRDGYVLQHSSIDKIALWVCEKLTREQLFGDADRRDRFQADPKLAKKARAELSDFRGSGYDRGHQAPAGNHKLEQRLNDETFYLSNMAPQAATLNRQIWAALEELTREWVRSRCVTRAKIITGGFFYDPTEDDPSTADGTVTYWTIGSGGVAVPTHFYKVVAGEFPDGRWQAIAFVMENRGYPGPWQFQEFVKSVDWVEERTGLDFMPELGPAEEARLERTASTMWCE